MDALRDLDDALTMMHLFSVLPSRHNRDQSIPVSLTNAARRLSMEFDAYIVKTNSLRKVFVSVRGYYYQVVWIDIFLRLDLRVILALLLSLFQAC